MTASISPPSDDVSEAPNALPPQAFEELDAILDELRARNDETPQWEFCEGFMAALACSRRPIPEAEYWEVLLGTSPSGNVDAGPAEEEGSFANAEQRERFKSLWAQRWGEVVAALDTEVQSLEDERCYHPEVMDVRAAVADLPEAEQSNFTPEELPAFAQVWALGFMFAVESWPHDWEAPRDRAVAKELDSALQAIVAMTEDDMGEPAVSPLQEEGPPSTSVERLNNFGDAIWAVYALRELWQGLGPRVATVRKEVEPGRNDPCPCGSGKKYKKCHGAA